MTEADLAFLQDLITDPSDVGSFMWQAFRDSGEWRQRWDSGHSLIRDTGGEVVVVADGDLAGVMSWSQTHWFGRPCWSLGVQLARPMRGRGIGTRAHQLIVDYLFDQTLRDRIEAYTEADNLAERRSLEKSGFTLEGTLRHVSFRQASWRDAVLYSTIRASST